MTPEQKKQLQVLEGLAEAAYSEMYETSSTAGLYSETKDCFAAAIAYAQSVGATDEAQRLERRLEHVKAVFRKQMS